MPLMNVLKKEMPSSEVFSHELEAFVQEILAANGLSEHDMQGWTIRSLLDRIEVLDANGHLAGLWMRRITSNP